ncbi:hypothetical protein [Candidatus Cyanaurora vandensis]|uniref:hypothetical protein n=1 Tax=Candidatus Cyanaurora vandensis TaxID=2714958 RepID=UPI00257BB35C|nr:hypothetical protein [Candidatus Cyanaurora vandensis]
MQDTLLLCQIYIEPVTLLGYRVALQYLIVAEGITDKPLRYIFSEFEDMNQLWLDLKSSSSEQVVEKLTSREEGPQRAAKPKPRPAGVSSSERTFAAPRSTAPSPAPRPRPSEGRSDALPPPRPRKPQ